MPLRRFYALPHWTTLLAPPASRGSLAAALIGLACANIAWAQLPTPTPGQIAQLKAMSPAEQQALAKSVGVDLGGATQANTQPQLSEPSLPTSQGTSDAVIVDGSENAAANDKVASLASPIFGLDLFRGDPQSFSPASGIPVPADYVLGPGDNLVIQLYGKENMTHPLTINREGQVQFPTIGPITLAGLSFEKAQDLIDTTVATRMVGVKASTTLGALRTIRVFVLGEVKKPGSFTVGALATMTNALFASGGITSVGSLRQVQLKRQGQVITTLDLYDLLLSGNTARDARLQPGDVIFIPPVGDTITFTGAVNRPARYELSGPSTLGAAIKMAGGLNNSSHAAHIAISRLNTLGERSLFNVDLNTAKGKNFALRDGDQIAVGSSLDYINNQVTVQGSAKRPGLYSWRPGLRFTDVVRNALEVIPGTDVNIALLQSLSPETGRIEARVFSPAAAWAEPKSQWDPVLSGYDEVFIFDLASPRSETLASTLALLKQQARFKEREQIVHIAGSVKFPGTYPLARNMTSHELIELAGGLTESAYATNGEITRYTISDKLERLVSHVSVNIEHEAKPLEPGDTLTIKQVPLWKDRETVSLTGEVMFPGVYTILPGESLLDVISRAGGLTPYAYPIGAIFSRQELRKLEQQRLDELRDTLEADLAASRTEQGIGKKEIDIEESRALLKKIDETKPLGRMVIDLPSLLAQPEKYDFPIEAGDTLVIPRYKPSVTVLGEVQYPTSHFYNEKLSAKEYIRRSGGTKKYADDQRIYVVKANGRVVEPGRSRWFSTRQESIEAGDTIIVPLDTDRVDSLEVWSKTTQIIYNAALGAAAVNSL
jgi:polysaccharide biosynthesis/export protein